MDKKLAVGDSWSLVGRDTQLREIMSMAGAAGGVVLCGAAGVGKTRLAREALARLGAAGRDTEWVAATRAASEIPFGAVSPLIPEDARFGADRLAMLRQIADGFVAEDRVLAVDDAHLLDGASAAVVHHLAARSLAFLVVTVRDGERCPDAVTALWKEGMAARIEVPSLPEPAIHALLDEAFGDQLETVSRQRLRHLAAGNPLLLREALRAGLDTGALRYRHGTWRWSGTVQPTSRLADVVSARLDAVERSVADVVEVVACGEPLPMAVLARLADPVAVAAAERQGLVVVTDGQAVLSHPLHGEVIRSTMPHARSRHVAAGLAAAMTASRARRRDDVLRAGVWQLRSGHTGDPDLLVTAAKQAMDRFDLGLAERLVRLAIESGGGVTAENVLAQILSHRGSYRESGDVLTESGDPTVRSDNLYWGKGDIDEAVRVLDDAGTAAAEANRSLLLMFDSQHEESLRSGAAVLAYQDAEPQAVVWAATGAGASAGLLGRHDQAAAIYRQGLSVATANREAVPWGAIQVNFGYSMALVAQGLLAEAQAVVDREYRAAQREEAAAPLGAWAGFVGVVAKARGDIAFATARLRESLSLLADYDTFQLGAPCLAELAGALALSGAHRSAVRLLARATSPERRISRLFLPWMELDRAWTIAAGGDTSAAAAQALSAAAMARDQRQPAVEAWALYDAARLGDARAVHASLARLAGEVPGPAVAVFAPAAAALAVGDAEALAGSALAFERLGMLLHAAEAGAAAGVLYAAGKQRASVLTERAAVLAGRCPGVRTPLLAVTGSRAVLTRREREVAGLAAAGRSSKQIAERLGLSIRTVDNYLGRAYTKLGIQGRAELRAALEPPDPTP